MQYLFDAPRGRCGLIKPHLERRETMNVYVETQTGKRIRNISGAGNIIGVLNLGKLFTGPRAGTKAARYVTVWFREHNGKFPFDRSKDKMIYVDIFEDEYAKIRKAFESHPEQAA